MSNDKVKNFLTNKKIYVRHIPDHKGGIKPKDHPLSGGMLDIATVTLYAKRSRNGSYVDPFTPDEREFVAQQLGLSPERLSIHNRDDNYWDTFSVSLSKSGMTLDMSNLLDFIKYKVLLTNDGIICDNPAHVRNKPSYRFLLVDEATEISSKSKTLSSRKLAYKSYGKFEEDKIRLGYIVWQMTSNMPNRTSKLEELQARIETNDLLEEKADNFNKLVSDKYFEYKVLIYKALINGVITRKNGEYFMEGVLVVKNGSNGNLQNTAQYLADPINQESKFLIEDRINNAKE